MVQKCVPVPRVARRKEKPWPPLPPIKDGYGRYGAAEGNTALYTSRGVPCQPFRMLASGCATPRPTRPLRSQGLREAECVTLVPVSVWQMRLLFGVPLLWYVSFTAAYRPSPFSQCWRGASSDPSSACCAPPIAMATGHGQSNGASPAAGGWHAGRKRSSRAIGTAREAVKVNAEVQQGVSGGSAGSRGAAEEDERLATLRTQDEEVWSVIQDEKRRQVRTFRTCFRS